MYYIYHPHISLPPSYAIVRYQAYHLRLHTIAQLNLAATGKAFGKSGFLEILVELNAAWYMLYIDHEPRAKYMVIGTIMRH